MTFHVHLLRIIKDLWCFKNKGAADITDLISTKKVKEIKEQKQEGLELRRQELQIQQEREKAMRAKKGMHYTSLSSIYFTKHNQSRKTHKP